MNNELVLENFIDFCENMMITNESLTLTDTTPKWMSDGGEKRRTYSTNLKSIFNSKVEIDSRIEITNDKELENKITKILNLVKSYKGEVDKMINRLFESAEDWEVPVKSPSELTKLILSLDNCLDISLFEDKFNVDLYINNSARNPNADKFFGNHSWVIYFSADSYETKKLQVRDAGLNG